MSDTSPITQFLSDLAETISATLVQSSEGIYALALDSETTVIIERSEDQQRLVLSSELGRLAPEHGAAVYPVLLAASMAAATGSGMRFGADGNGTISLICDVVAPQTSEATLINLIGRLKAGLPHWRRIIASGSALQEAQPTAIDPATMMRV